MQFNDGSEVVDPGEHVTYHDEDLGSASYDSDHDGVADSVIIGQNDYSIVLTDTNHDGTADSATAYDSEGHEVNPSSVGSGDGGTPGDTGTSGQSAGDAGATGLIGDPGPGAGAGQGTESSGATGSDSSGATDSDSSGGTDSDSSGGTDTGPVDGGADAGTETTDTGTSDTGVAAGGISVTGDDGQLHELGEPTADLNGDGTPDTAIVSNPDGSTTGFTDVDGDGHAEQMTTIDQNGSVTIAVDDGSGHWQVAATGHLDADGTFVEDQAGTAAGQSAGQPQTGPPESGPPESGQPESGQPESGQSGAETGPSTEPGTDELNGLETPGPEITFTAADGQTYELGAPTADLNGDGTPDTVVTEMPDGTVVGYSDVDGDGQADQVTQIDLDGSVTIGVPDGNGGWEKAATGHLGDNGEFVPDESAGPPPGTQPGGDVGQPAQNESVSTLR